jgi:protein phosphatase
VVDAGKDNPDLEGMGTTLTLAVFDGAYLEIGHVGDSRAYLLRDGVLEQLTTDHSLVAEMVARGDITAEEAAVHPYRSVITRAVGLQPEVEVDRVSCVIEAGDRVLLCSDGLTGMVPAAGIRDILTAESHPTESVWSLIEAANEAGGVDNISVVVVAAGND